MAIKRCTTSFSANIDGVPRVITEGTLVEDGDPVLAGREHLFETVETHVTRRSGVEQTTADPGEKRAPRRGKSPTVQKKEQ